jgi:hypothetical protein
MLHVIFAKVKKRGQGVEKEFKLNLYCNKNPKMLQQPTLFVQFYNTGHIIMASRWWETKLWFQQFHHHE